MSGHSKWHNIRIRKTKADAARGKIFAKCIRELTIAARQGGKDPENNPALRHAIEKAKENNMPQETIKRAILRGVGEIPGEVYEEMKLEGYGPGGIALLIDLMTDNRQRSVAQIRHILNKLGGSLGEAGCTAWLFKRKAVLQVSSSYDEDQLLSIVLEAGAEDLKKEGESYQIIAEPEQLDEITRALSQNSIPLLGKEITYLPQNTVRVEGEEAVKVLKLMEALEENEDVKEVYANFDIEDKILEEVASVT